MGVLVKDGVTFGVIAPRGFAILSAIHQVADLLSMDLVITSATDGEHAPGGPHSRGEAFDLRTKDMDIEMKGTLKSYLEHALGPRFTVLQEHLGGVQEHLHIQPKKGLAP
jgi:hypothetical protein